MQGNDITIELIEDSGLYFTGLKKDYKSGEKARIEVSYSYGTEKQDVAKKLHEIVAKISS